MAHNDNAIDLPGTIAKWSARSDDGGLKVRSLTAGNLRGGDFILNADGAASTLSFAFCRGSGIVGLTIGRLVDANDPIGQPIFAFAENDPKPSEDGPPQYSVLEIGTVVSFSEVTDSLVFKFHQEYHCKVDLLSLAPESGLETPLTLPVPTMNPQPTAVGTVVVGYGAQRRGAHGEVRTSSKMEDGLYSRRGDIAIVSSADTDFRLTDEGDAGTLFLDVGTGRPIYFHRAGSEETMTPKESFGIPLALVMAHHSQLGG